MKEKDPVCGMELEKWDAFAEIEIVDKTYYFCSKDCRDLFVKKPKKYMKSVAGRA